MIKKLWKGLRLKHKIGIVLILSALFICFFPYGDIGVASMRITGRSLLSFRTLKTVVWLVFIPLGTVLYFDKNEIN